MVSVKWSMVGLLVFVRSRPPGEFGLASVLLKKSCFGQQIPQSHYIWRSDPSGMCHWYTIVEVDVPNQKKGFVVGPGPDPSQGFCAVQHAVLVFSLSHQGGLSGVGLQ